jgi:hypothetical protein
MSQKSQKKTDGKLSLKKQTISRLTGYPVKFIDSLTNEVHTDPTGATATSTRPFCVFRR